MKMAIGPWALPLFLNIRSTAPSLAMNEEPDSGSESSESSMVQPQVWLPSTVLSEASDALSSSLSERPWLCESLVSQGHWSHKVSSLESSSLRGSSLESSSLRGSSLETSSLSGSSLETSSLETSSLEVSSLEASSLEASSLEVCWFEICSFSWLFEDSSSSALKAILLI